MSFRRLVYFVIGPVLYPIKRVMRRYALHLVLLAFGVGAGGVWSVFPTHLFR